MVRKILPLQSTTVATATTTNVPISSRLWYFQGEADGKPTYDFQISLVTWNTDAASVAQVTIKYCGVKNGQKVMLHTDWPHVATQITTPNATGEVQIIVTPGTGVNGQVFYLSGTLAAG